MPFGREIFIAAALLSILLNSTGGGITSTMDSGNTPVDWI
jgi:hypothetical protein